MKDVWRFIVMDSGEQYAVLGSVQLMLTLSAGNWDMMLLHFFITHTSKWWKYYYGFYNHSLVWLMIVSLYGLLMYTVLHMMYAFLSKTLAQTVQYLLVLIPMIYPSNVVCCCHYYNTCFHYFLLFFN